MIYTLGQLEHSAYLIQIIILLLPLPLLKQVDFYDFLNLIWVKFKIDIGNVMSQSKQHYHHHHKSIFSIGALLTHLSFFWIIILSQHSILSHIYKSPIFPSFNHSAQSLLHRNLFSSYLYCSFSLPYQSVFFCPPHYNLLSHIKVIQNIWKMVFYKPIEKYFILLQL